MPLDKLEPAMQDITFLKSIIIDNIRHTSGIIVTTNNGQRYVSIRWVSENQLWSTQSIAFRKSI